jgi:hypothetical protein
LDFIAWFVSASRTNLASTVASQLTRQQALRQKERDDSHV